MGSGMRSMETRSQSGAHPKGKKKREIFSGAVVTTPHQRAHQVSRPRHGEASSYFWVLSGLLVGPWEPVFR